METGSTQATPSAAEDIHLSSTLSGSSMPIRAPLTIDSDSDSEFPLSVSNQIRCRTCSSSSISSIYSYGSENDGYTNVDEEEEEDEDDTFVTDSDEEVVIESSYDEEYAFSRPLVKYPDGDFVQKTQFGESNDFRPFVKNPVKGDIGGSSSGDVEKVVAPDVPFSKPDVIDFGILSPGKLAMPIAQLTGDTDVESAGSEVEDGWSNSMSMRIPSAEIVGNVVVGPKVRDFGTEQVEDYKFRYEDAFFGDNISVTMNDCISAESFESVGPKVDEAEKLECLNEVMKHSESAKGVRVLRLSETDGDEMEVGDVILGEVQNIGFLGSRVEKGNLDSIKNPSSEKLVEDMGSDSFEAEKGESMVESYGSSSLENMKLDDEVEHLHDEFQHNVGIRTVEDFISRYVVEDMELNDSDFDCLTRSKDCDSSVSFSAEDVKHLDGEIQPFEDAAHENQISDTATWQGEINQKSCREFDMHVSVICNTVELCGLTADQKEAVCGPQRLAVDSEVAVANYNEHLKIHDSDRKSDGEFEKSLSGSSCLCRKSHQRLGGQIVSDSDNQVDAVKESDFFYSISNECKGTVSIEEEEMLEKIRQRRVKFLRLVHLLGLSTEDSTVAKMLYRLGLVSGRPSMLEVEGEECRNQFDFSLTILVIGKTGVGKSATINSIFGEHKSMTNAFHPATTTVKEIVGHVNGVNVRVLDTPGLRSSILEQSYNRKVLSSIKRCMRKCPPDVVLYVDRLDTHPQDLNDLHFLRSITSSLGLSVWRNCIIALTHAASIPPDKPSGFPLSYMASVSHRCRVIQQLISSLGVGDLCMVIPVCPVENHPFYKQSENGEILLPDGKSWKPQLLLLCYSVKILSESNSLGKTFLDSPECSKLFGFTDNLLSLPSSLSSLWKSSAYQRSSPNPKGGSIDSVAELASLTCSDRKDEDEYDQLLPFRQLSRRQIEKLSKEHKKAYFEGCDYRVKLLQMKQWSLVFRMYS